MKKKIKLTEADLQDIVREVISEATATPKRWTKMEVDSLRDGDIFSNSKTGIARMKHLLPELTSIAHNMTGDGGDSDQIGRYAKALSFHLDKAQDLVNRIADIEIMKRGEQPDGRYYDKHQKQVKIPQNSADRDYPTYDTYN